MNGGMIARGSSTTRLFIIPGVRKYSQIPSKDAERLLSPRAPRKRGRPNWTAPPLKSELVEDKSAEQLNWESSILSIGTNSQFQSVEDGWWKSDRLEGIKNLETSKDLKRDADYAPSFAKTSKQSVKEEPSSVTEEDWQFQGIDDGAWWPESATAGQVRPKDTMENTKKQKLNTVTFKPMEQEHVQNSINSQEDSSEPDAVDKIISSASTPAMPRPAPPLRPYKPRTLPASPLADSSYITAREDYLPPKVPPGKILTPFQQRLRKNPYALALATPIRRCALSEAMLPSFFLQDFELVADPKTGNPWYMPRSLTSKHAFKEPPTSRLGPALYTLANGWTLAQLQNASGLFVRKITTDQALYPIAQRLVSARARQVKPLWNLAMRSNWRTDMHKFVLKLMRRRVVENLTYLNNVKRGYLVGCKNWDVAKAKPQTGAFLWTGGEGEPAGEAPPEFAILDLEKVGERARTRKVPVHNLRMLLGEQKLTDLRDKCRNGVFGNEIVVLKHKNVAVETQLMLWKLQGYVANFEGFLQAEQQAENLDEGESDDGDVEENDFEEETPMQGSEW